MAHDGGTGGSLGNLPAGGQSPAPDPQTSQGSQLSKERKLEILHCGFRNLADAAGGIHYDDHAKGNEHIRFLAGFVNRIHRESRDHRSRPSPASRVHIISVNKVE